MTTALRDIPLTRAGSPLLPLAEATDQALVGGKARNLARMMSLGLSVPGGAVITTRTFDAHVSSIAGEIGRIEARVAEAAPADRHAAANSAAGDIRALVRDIPLADGLRRAIADAVLPMLSEGPVVVRSSAVGEDSARESYAGQLDSFLGLTSLADVEHAVVACWASCWSERAIAYRIARDLVPSGMGVVIQQQVGARASGVMFTRTADATILVEYTSGLGEALVSGEVTPGRFAMDRQGNAMTTLARGDHQDAVADWMVTSSHSRAQLADAAETLEDGLGGPQDVEWSFDERGTLQLVQSRPITMSVTARGVRDDGRPTRWSNANVNENYPEPISPFLYSIASAAYAHYFRNLVVALGLPRRRIAAMDDALSHIVGVHGGRVYYNLTSIHAVIRAAPFGGALVHVFNRFVGATGGVDGTEPPSTTRLRDLWDTARVVVTAIRAYYRMGRRIAEFEAMIDDFAARSHRDRLPGYGLRDLRLLLAEFMQIRRHGWTPGGLADSASAISYALLNKLVDRAYDGADAGALHNTLLQAIPGLISAEPVHRLWALSRTVRADVALSELFARPSREVLRTVRRDPRFAAFRKELDDYLEQWGFRCSSELMLTLPTYQDDPEPLIDAIRAYARVAGESPADALARQAMERDLEVQRLAQRAAGRPVARWLPFISLAFGLRTTLAWTQASVGYRERARLKQALLYSRVRGLALAMGAQLVHADLLDAPDDVFWFTVSEVDEIAAGTAMFPHDLRAQVALRKAGHARLSASTPPDAFTLPEGWYLSLDGADHAHAGADPGTHGGRFTGTGACGGRVQGRAVVLRDVREASRLREGDILVTRQTDPGWAPVFFLIRGLVIERGGMLSHGAIVAREFGLPCVVGVAGATTAIPDGAIIDVNGDAGTVHVVA